MSKITKALEKAARERLWRERQELAPVVPTPPEAATQVVARTKTDAPVINSKIDPHIVAFFDRQSPIAEQYRMLRTNLQSVKTSRGFKTLLITSALHGEGKTVTSLNLALTLAQQPGCNVLLIDADLRKGSIKRWLGMEQRPGLSEALTDGVAVQDLFVKLEKTNLTVLPSGGTLPEPTEFLDSPKMRGVLQQFKQQFDYILVDSPPVLLVTDPAVLSQQVDGVIIVARAGRTPRRALLEMQTRLEQVNAKLLGTILTHAEYTNPLYGRYYPYYAKDGDRLPVATR